MQVPLVQGTENNQELQEHFVTWQTFLNKLYSSKLCKFLQAYTLVFLLRQRFIKHRNLIGSGHRA